MMFLDMTVFDAHASRDFAAARLRLVLATASLTALRRYSAVNDGAADHVFFVATSADENAIARMSMVLLDQHSVSAVLLRCLDGKLPTEIIIREQSSIGGRVWRDCDLWLPDDGRTACIRPKTEAFGFVHDGRHLHRIHDLPAGDRATGSDAASKRLVRIVQDLPDDLITQFSSNSAYGWPMLACR